MWISTEWHNYSIVLSVSDEFDTVYRLQDNNQSFTDLESMLNAWSSKFPALLEVSLAHHLRKDGFSDRFIDELVNAATRCNYNQRADKIHAFVGKYFFFND